MKKLILILTMLPILMYSQQDTNKLSFGIFGGFGLNFHSADFKKIPTAQAVRRVIKMVSVQE